MPLYLEVYQLVTRTTVNVDIFNNSPFSKFAFLTSIAFNKSFVYKRENNSDAKISKFYSIKIMKIVSLLRLSIKLKSLSTTKKTL